jgi:hypothetical protein
VPIRLSETPGAVRTPSPALGEHTEEVLRDLLELLTDEITALRVAGVKFFPIRVSALPDTAFQLASRRPSCASVRRVRLGVPGHQLAIRPLVRSRADSTLAPRGHPEGRPIVRRLRRSACALRRSACASPQNQHTLPDARVVARPRFEPVFQLRSRFSQRSRHVAGCSAREMVRDSNLSMLEDRTRYGQSHTRTPYIPIVSWGPGRRKPGCIATARRTRPSGRLPPDGLRTVTGTDVMHFRHVPLLVSRTEALRCLCSRDALLGMHHHVTDSHPVADLTDPKPKRTRTIERRPNTPRLISSAIPDSPTILSDLTTTAASPRQDNAPSPPHRAPARSSG